MISIHFQKIKNIYRSKKGLVENYISLSFLQAANYLFPLITLPYLVRVLGPEKFGFIAFAQALINYFQILTDYGFSLSATREISINAKDKLKVSEIFSSVMIIKLFLVIISFVILSLVIFIFDAFSKDWIIYYCTFGVVIGECLFPQWFFQGMEKMKYITILNVVSRIIFTISIFIFIRQPSDYVYVPLLNSTGFITAGIIALYVVFKHFQIKFFLPSIHRIKHHFYEGGHVFVSTIAVTLYTNSNTFILGLLTNHTAVGYYTAAEKLIKALTLIPLTPVAQSTYPYISKLVSESKEKALNFIRKVLLIIGTTSFVYSCVIFIFSEFFIKIVFGDLYSESVILLRILSFLPFVITLNNIFGMQTLLNFGYKETFAKIFVSCGLINLFSVTLFTYGLGYIGTAIATLSVETLIPIVMWLFLESKKIKLIRIKNTR